MQVPHPIGRPAKKPVGRKPCRLAGGLRRGCQKPVWRAQRAQPIPEARRAVFGMSKTSDFCTPCAETTWWQRLRNQPVLRWARRMGRGNRNRDQCLPWLRSIQGFQKGLFSERVVCGKPWVFVRGVQNPEVFERPKTARRAAGMGCARCARPTGFWKPSLRPPARRQGLRQTGFLARLPMFCGTCTGATRRPRIPVLPPLQNLSGARMGCSPVASLRS